MSLRNHRTRNNRNNQYINGNYIVIYQDLGAQLRKEAFRIGEDLCSDFPDSIDLKITNKCSWGCSFCHESSTPCGKTFSYKRTIKVLESLPRLPLEIAIGGGNILDCPAETLKLVKWLKHRGFRVRATLNYKDYIRTDFNELQIKLINEIPVFGISLDHYSENEEKPPLFARKNIVYHIIAGIFPIQDLEKILSSFDRIPLLILGYKQWGRAKNADLPDMTLYKKILKDNIPRISVKIISFDNLALEQLGVKDLLSPSVFNSIYMGDEGSHSMYIDAVNEEFARTSRSPKRMSWRKIGVIDYFKGLQNGIDN